jgi:putative ABC transport system ATP-binding protein
MKLMHDFRARGKTVIIASHDPIVFEDEEVDLLVDMRDGRLRDTVRNGQTR